MDIIDSNRIGLMPQKFDLGQGISQTFAGLTGSKNLQIATRSTEFAMIRTAWMAWQ
jgi:hypothetical protein